MSEPFKLRHPRDGRLHHSDAKLMALSPLHARWAAEHPREPTPAMRRGTAIDRLVLGEKRKLVVYRGARNTKAWDAIELMAKGVDVAICPAPNRNSNAYKDMALVEQRPVVLEPEYSAAFDLLGGKACDLGEIVTPDEYEAANGAAQAVLTSPVVLDLGLLEGEHQRVVHWDMYGLPWGAGIAGERGGFDVLGDAFINDLKSSTCAEPGWLSRQVRKMRYVEQLYSYGQGAFAIGHKIERYYLTCVEVAAPFAVTVLSVPASEIEDAGRVVYGWCERIRQCEEAGHWPGYVQSATDIEPKSEWDTLAGAEDT